MPAIDVNLAHQFAAGIELRGDARAKIHGVADQPLVAGFERGHQSFAGIAGGVEDGDRSAIQRLRRWSW